MQVFNIVKLTQQKLYHTSEEHAYVRTLMLVAITATVS